MSDTASAKDVAAWIGASEIRIKICTLLIEEFNVRSEQLCPAAKLDEDLCLDSLEFLDFSATLEDRLGITLSLEVLGVARTLQDLVDLAEAAHSEKEDL